MFGIFISPEGSRFGAAVAGAVAAAGAAAGAAGCGRVTDAVAAGARCRRGSDCGGRGGSGRGGRGGSGGGSLGASEHRGETLDELRRGGRIGYELLEERQSPARSGPVRAPPLGRLRPWR